MALTLTLTLPILRVSRVILLRIGNQNQWKVAAESMGILIFFVIIAATHIGAFIFAIVRLVQYIKARGFNARRIATTALSLNIIGTLIGSIFWSVDPDGTFASHYHTLHEKRN